MSTLDIRHNIRAVARDFSDLARRELPFATSLALNATIDDVKRNAEKRLAKVIDRPAPFTMRAFATRRSSKSRLAATVFAKDIQAGYLRWLEEGGTRRPAGRAIVVPVGQRVNRYGNLPRGAVQGMLARRDVFSGAPGGRAGGIYQRLRHGLRLLAHYTPRARYRRGLQFQEIRAQDGRGALADPVRTGHARRACLASELTGGGFRFFAAGRHAGNSRPRFVRVFPLPVRFRYALRLLTSLSSITFTR